jgi:parallel beta-helix repeat protein
MLSFKTATASMNFWLMKDFFFIFIIFLITACNSVESKNTEKKMPSPAKNNTEKLSNCPNWMSGQTVKIIKNTTIPSHCSYQRISFSLERDNIIFNCNGTSLNGLNQPASNAFFTAYRQSSAPKHWAFSVWKSGIQIKNCRIKNYMDGIVIRSRIAKQQHKMLRNKKNVIAIENQLRIDSPHNITISNTKIHHSHKHGLYMQRYVHHVNFIHGEIKYSGNSAIYLESGTQYNSIRNSYFYKNGYSNYKKKKRMRMPKLPSAEREAIAVDSSAYNEFIGNTFENNGKGAIFFYKNCFEKHKNANQLPRVQHANHNKVRNNRFINERYGVWLASRQSKQLSRFKCGDPVMYQESGFFGLRRYYHDYAKNNQIVNNTFKGVMFGIVVEDNDNRLINNKFIGNSTFDILIGTAYRFKSKNQPVTGTLVQQNQRRGARLKLEYSYGSTVMGLGARIQ